MTAGDPEREAALREQDRLPLAERALERGDYRELGRLLAGLRDADSSESQARAARLARAIEVDRVHLLVLGGCTLLLFAIALHYLVP